MWLPLDAELKDYLKKAGVEAVAILRDANGNEVGRILIGRPLGNINFSNRNLSSIETALLLVSAAISSERGPEA